MCLKVNCLKYRVCIVRKIPKATIECGFVLIVFQNRRHFQVVFRSKALSTLLNTTHTYSWMDWSRAHTYTHTLTCVCVQCDCLSQCLPLPDLPFEFDLYINMYFHTNICLFHSASSLYYPIHNHIRQIVSDCSTAEPNRVEWRERKKNVYDFYSKTCLAYVFVRACYARVYTAHTFNISLPSEFRTLFF